MTTAYDQDCVIDTPECPETLSGLIRLAIDDARTLRQSQYHPHWSVWHQRGDHSNAPPSSLEKRMCNVCLAGAVIAGTLSADKEKKREPANFSKYGKTSQWERGLRALDFVRRGTPGYYESAISMFLGRGNPPRGFKSHDIPGTEYPDFVGWDQFEKHCESLHAVADAFEAQGY